MDLQLDGAALTAWLVDTPSVSGDEGPLADAIEAALRPLPHLTVHRDGNTIVARTTLGRPERVILAGHVDTVPVAGNLPSRLEGPRLYGCGTSDMKAGVAVQLRLAAGLTSPRRDVTYVFYDCEEIAADRNGLLRLSRNRPDLLAGDFAVLMEPSSGEIEGGCQGTLRAEIAVAGQRAHTARSWMGRNAIHEAAEVLEVLRGYTPRQPPSGRGRVGRGRRRDAAGQARLDRRGPVLRARHPRRELRARRLRDRAHTGRVRGDGEDRRVRGPPAGLAAARLGRLSEARLSEPGPGRAASACCARRRPG